MTQTYLVRTVGEDITEMSNLINSRLSQLTSGIGGGFQIESVTVTPVYTTILENTILQGYIGLIVYSSN